VTGLTEQEREALTIALYGTDFGANGWLGRVECEQFAAAMGPAVESILTDRLAAHEAREARVRALHEPALTYRRSNGRRVKTGDFHCVTCLVSEVEREEWPCETIRALDGPSA